MPVPVAFYAPCFSAQSPILPDEEIRHAQVLRLKVNNKATILNGKGDIYTGVITAIGKNKCHLSIHDHQQIPPPPTLRIGVAPPKNPNRLRFLVEKAQELGATHLDFIQSQYSNAPIPPIARLERVTISALKQAQQPFLTTLQPICPLAAYLEQVPEMVRYVADADGVRLSSPSSSACQPCCLLVGPEGGFSSEEIATMTERGFVPVGLAVARLRVETACVVAVDQIQQIRHLSQHHI